MEYKIIVTRYEENKDYEAELKQWENNRGYNGTPRPEQMLEKRTLEVFLTEEEYNAVKKSVLETFK